MIFTADEKCIINELAIQTKGDILHALLKTKNSIAEESQLQAVAGLIPKIKSLTNREYRDLVKNLPLQLEENTDL
jgi:hypothetical protein